MSAEPGAGASGAVPITPTRPLQHPFPTPSGHWGGTHSELRGFTWEDLWPDLSDRILGGEGRQRRSLGSAPHPVDLWPGSPVPGHPVGPFSCTAPRRLVVSTAKHALIACSRRQNERELAVNYTKFIYFGGGKCLLYLETFVIERGPH